MGTLSEHFDWDDVTRSDKAAALKINNVLPKDLGAVILNTSRGMERVRACLGKPIYIDSWYRCLELNRAVGSKDTSDHLKGRAVDFVSPKYGSSLQICDTLVKYKELIRFKQLILEHTWVHISFDDPSVKPKLEVLSLLNGGKYALGLTNIKGEPYGIA